MLHKQPISENQKELSEIDNEVESKLDEAATVSDTRYTEAEVFSRVAARIHGEPTA